MELDEADEMVSRFLVLFVPSVRVLVFARSCTRVCVCIYGSLSFIQTTNRTIYTTLAIASLDSIPSLLLPT